MTIGIDCGNSYIKIGLFIGKKLKNVIRFPVEDINKFRIPDDWEKLNIEVIALASVSPFFSDKIKNIFSSFFNKEIIIITSQQCNIPLNIKDKKRVGVDRVLNCKGASVLYGNPSIVVDIGTAITIDFVNRNGVFEGGVIFPGPSLLLNSLNKTSLIKSPNFLKKNILIGKNTDECITSGLNNGIAGCIENVVCKIKNIHKNSNVILTGGWCNYFYRKIKIKKIVKKNLTLEGINIVIRERWLKK